MNAKTFAVIISLLLVIFIIELIRRQKMTFKYSMFWLSASLATLFLAVYDKLLSRMASLAGFELTSNFVFFLFLAFMCLLCLFLTVYINEQNSRTEALSQALGIMEFRIRELEKKLDPGSTKETSSS